MTQSIVPETHLTIMQACRKLGIRESVLRKFISEGKLASESFGRRKGIRPEWIEEFIDKHGAPEPTRDYNYR